MLTRNLPKSLNWLTAFLCIVTLGWTQFATASYNCPMEMPSIHPMSMGGMHHMQPGSTLLCKAHCEKPVQSATPHSPVAIFSLLFTVLPAIQPVTTVAVAQIQPVRLTNSSPPLRIQYQTFRN